MSEVIIPPSSLDKAPSPAAAAPAAGKFYAVAHGYKRGVYEDWTDVQKQIDGFPQPVYKKFECRDEAERFVADRKAVKIQLPHPEPAADKYYAVARGYSVGVMTEWDDVKKATENYPQPMFKKFDSLNDARHYYSKFSDGIELLDVEPEEKKTKKVEEKAPEQPAGKKEEKEVEKEKEQKTEVEEKKVETKKDEVKKEKKAPAPKKEKVSYAEAAASAASSNESDSDAAAPGRRATRGGAKTVYYAVARGNKTGVFTVWDECKAATAGFKGAKFKKFDEKKDAELFAQGKTLKQIEDMKNGKAAKGSPKKAASPKKEKEIKGKKSPAKKRAATPDEESNNEDGAEEEEVIPVKKARAAPKGRGKK